MSKHRTPTESEVRTATADAWVRLGPREARPVVRKWARAWEDAGQHRLSSAIHAELRILGEENNWR